ncbi:MAG: hypothetical protein ACTSQI_01260 [Candidatus Helarchaeota archaeon]
MSQIINDLTDLKRILRFIYVKVFSSPIMEEGLLIGIAIVAILIVLGIIFGVFDWIAKSFGSLFDHF